MKKILLTVFLVTAAFTLAESQTSVNSKSVAAQHNLGQKLDSVHYLPPVPVPLPEYIPIPWPGPVCLSCPPFPLDRVDQQVLPIDQLQIRDQIQQELPRYR